jgi:hypothetical protein
VTVTYLCDLNDIEAEDDTAHPELPMARVKLLDALCHDCKAPVTVWRTGVGRLMTDRRSPDGPPMERHQCAMAGFLVAL